MRLQKEIHQAYCNHIREHMEENRQAGIAIREHLENSPLMWNGVLDKTVHIPKVFDGETLQQFEDIAAITYGIFQKVIREYREHADYRALFPFSKELEELILLPQHYDSLLPIARFDLFYNEDTGDFKFCEINTDGTAAMLRDLEMGKALSMNPAHQAVLQRYDLRPFELFDTWVETFLRLYETYPGHKEHPYVAMVDFLENATIPDFQEFQRRFQKAGVEAEICEIRELTYRDGVLYAPSGHAIDAVYRRAVTADIMDHYDEVAPFLQAVRENAVFLAGAFMTQVIHSKWLFYVLHLDRTKQFLTCEERAFVEAHIPLTLEFSSKFISLEEVQSNKDAYMIKPMDAYASKGIYAAGHEHDQASWNRLTEELYGQGYICQEYCQQYLTENIDFGWGDGQWHPYLNMPGLYVYDGRFSGILMRMAEGDGIIVAHENERTVPVFRV